jgi:uncharacterized damage-inducible protein DinB|tara:strand:- start:2230 stop:2754 length:525 start_codon:yes stop_codon:yes gene_type:complete
MKDKNYMLTLFEYNSWANTETYRMVAAMPEDEIYKVRKTPLQSIFVSLHHLINVDLIWIAHMQQKTHNIAELREVKYKTFEELWNARKKIDLKLIEYVKNIDELDLTKIIHYELIGGNKGALSRAMCLTHLVTHSSYHRGWISDMFGQADCKQPSTDIPVYERALREKGELPLP